MALSWNEIKDRAIRFSKEWELVSSEDAEAKSFWDDFFNIFGVSRRKVATFEQPVKKLDASTGYIDLLWKGTILVEHKSRGKDLDKAYRQALDYFPGLKDYELPKYVLVSDFARFRLYDLDEGTTNEFALADLYQHVSLFGFIAGYQKHVFREQDPVNIRAAELMGKLHDRLRAIGYTGHPLELYLVRLVFCLFAEDTSIFQKDQFRDYILNKTREDGSDLAHHLSTLFYLLNTPRANRLTNLDEELNAFPYINGKLFEESLPPASFDSGMRNSLLECTTLNWGKISPAIFGSLFQSVMNPQERRNLGAHYTSEKNILKVIKPLFLDALLAEFESAKENRNKLIRFHEKIAALRFLDPACGCGNFLVIAYRELRLLELQIITTLQKGQQVFDIGELTKLDVDRFYGIEIEEFPARIAQVALWLMDHQMNMRLSEEFGQYFLRLPLRKSANIVCANALRLDWHSLIEQLPWENRELRFDYIFGNPPFIGYAWQTPIQKDDMSVIFGSLHGAGVLDFVSAWYIKSAKYLHQFNKKSENSESFVRVAFVSTNSITQGEQVGILWGELFRKYSIKIHFAHQTFKWSNEAKANAGVHVVIIGFSNFDINSKLLFLYDDIKGEPTLTTLQNINPYLVEGQDVFLEKRKQPICSVPSINRGSDATDEGHLLLDQNERYQLLKEHPEINDWIRPFLMGKEFLNNIPRFCLWLKDIKPEELKRYHHVYSRIEKVKKFRLSSKRKQTLKMADFPYLFGEDRQPDTNYLAIPKVSSENRVYIPIGFCTSDIICGDKLFYLPDATLWHFGIITSLMQMTWMKYTCGRLKSDYSYSNTIVYNNFPWPQNPTEKQRQTVEELAQAVLGTRQRYPGSSLADLYDPLTMPPDLVKAHQTLDKAVDQCYRPQPFPDEMRRIEFLFNLYDQYTANLFSSPKRKPKPS